VIRSILVPLDGSHHAEAALPMAVRMASAARADVRLFLAHHPAAVAAGVAEPGRGGTSVDVRRAQELSYLASTAARLESGLGRPVRFELREGAPAEILEDYLLESGPDLVVMATHGQGPTSPFWLGSVADHVLRRTAAPLLLVRPTDGEDPSAVGPLRCVLAAVDLSDDSGAMLEPLAHFASLTQAHVTLLHVIGDPRPAAGWSEPWREPQCRAPQCRLDDMADDLRARGVRSAACVIISQDVAGAILDRFERGTAEVLVLAARPPGGSRGGEVGAVADKVIRGARKPVLVLRKRSSVGVGDGSPSRPGAWATCG
jgi:nucleotide-binding universal stress UspA family protein